METKELKTKIIDEMLKTNIPLFKPHASQIYRIMAYANQNKLGNTAITYINEFLAEKFFNRKKTIVSKFLEKGKQLEEESIKIAEQVLNQVFFKNEKTFENDFFIGTPDIILLDEIIDIKTSWDCFTFPIFELEPEQNYIYQLHVYMDLLGLNKAKLIYVLTNAQEYQIKNEAISYCRQAGIDIYNDEEKFKQAVEYFTRYLNYDDIEKKYRVKIFNINRDDEIIKQMKNKVVLCREKIQEIINEIIKYY